MSRINLHFRIIYRKMYSTLTGDTMKDERKIRANKQKASYDERMKALGLVKMCIWVSPFDDEHMKNQGRLSRKRHMKRLK